MGLANYVSVPGPTEGGLNRTPAHVHRLEAGIQVELAPARVTSKVTNRTIPLDPEPMTTADDTVRADNVHLYLNKGQHNR